MKLSNCEAGKAFDIGASASGIFLKHIFEPEDIEAVQAARLSKRPLLLRGEPGAGKSQLARAASVALSRAFVSFVVDARTEARDLKWREDVVARLADAQLVGGLDDSSEAKALRGKLDLTNYVQPGPLWWGFDPESAQTQADRAQGSPVQADTSQSKSGVVVLIDEIDKGGSEVPNGLLEALGAREFTPPGQVKPVSAGDAWPLIVITTNEERRLPDAFLRRCVVHNMKLPKTETAFVKYLQERGAAYYPDPAVQPLLKEAATQTWRDRDECKEKRLKPLPGQAEYLDLLRAVFSEDDKGLGTPKERLDTLSRYFLRKHVDLD